MVSYIKGGTQAKIFENRILRRIFELKRDLVARMGEDRSAFKILQVHQQERDF